MPELTPYLLSVPPAERLATRPPDTDTKNMLARPVDSAIVATGTLQREVLGGDERDCRRAGFAVRIGGLLFIIRHDYLRNRRATGWGRTRRPCTPALGPLFTKLGINSRRELRRALLDRAVGAATQ